MRIKQKTIYGGFFVDKYYLILMAYSNGPFIT